MLDSETQTISKDAKLLRVDPVSGSLVQLTHASGARLAAHLIGIMKKVRDNPALLDDAATCKTLNNQVLEIVKALNPNANVELLQGSPEKKMEDFHELGPEVTVPIVVLGSLLESCFYVSNYKLRAMPLTGLDLTRIYVLGKNLLKINVSPLWISLIAMMLALFLCKMVTRFYSFDKADRPTATQQLKVLNDLFKKLNEQILTKLHELGDHPSVAAQKGILRANHHTLIIHWFELRQVNQGLFLQVNCLLMHSSA